MKPWHLLSALLTYPTSELRDAEEELRAAASGDPGSARFLDWLCSVSLADAQLAYVETFDFDRRASLHLTYHSHGDSRQRGLALVRLKRRYGDAGFPLGGDELPDYLPVLLEFAGLAGTAGEDVLNEHRAEIELIRTRLHDLESPYADLLDSLVGTLPRLRRDQLEAARKLAEEGPPSELVGLEPYPVGASA
ncbi:MAG TPA: nitrate reductase molybdenum cofactor assembly chaperone [Gaiellaceae bacterium]|nr:nitrate reductase molybdenum cofactor assembly chaperone [Gaiellaceae bacterium]